MTRRAFVSRHDTLRLQDIGVRLCLREFRAIADACDSRRYWLADALSSTGELGMEVASISEIVRCLRIGFVVFFFAAGLGRSMPSRSSVEATLGARTGSTLAV